MIRNAGRFGRMSFRRIIQEARSNSWTATALRYTTIKATHLQTGRLAHHDRLREPVGQVLRPIDRQHEVLLGVDLAQPIDRRRQKLAPDGGKTTPALAEMAGAYSPEAFHKLMRTGVGMSNRDLGLMKMVATESASSFTDEEITAIQTYLKSDEAKTAK